MEKYYLKSISRTIKKDKIQPLIIILILILSFIVTNMSISLSNAFSNNTDLRDYSETGNAEIVISSNSDSESRFFIKEDILEKIDNIDVTGSFDVPFIYNGNLIDSIAIDFTDANQFFEFNFIEYSDFNYIDRKNIIFITDDFSNKYNLKLNDSITINLFGKECEYIIKGISRTPFLGYSELLIDTSSVINLYKEISPYLSLFTDDITLYGKAYIITKDKDLNRVIDSLNEIYTDISYDKIESNVSTEHNDISKVISIIMVIISFVATFSIILITTYCINKKREYLLNLFSLVGYTKNKLVSYRIIEMIIYLVISYLLSIPLSIIFGNICFKIIDFEFALYKYSISSSIIIFFVLLIACILPIIISYSKINLKIKNISNKIILIGLPIILLILFILTFTLRGDLKVYFAVSAMLLSFLYIFISVKPFMSYIAFKLSKNTKNFIKHIAYLNIIKIKELTNMSKLLILLLSIFLFSISVSISSVSTYYSKDYYLKGDFIVTNVNSKLYNNLKELDEIDSIYGFYYAHFGTENDSTVGIWAAESIECFSTLENFDRLPQGNEIYTSYAYANKYGLKKGDKVTLTYNRTKYEFFVKEVDHGAEYNFLIDPSYVGLSYNYYFINLKDNINIEEAYENITSLISRDMALLIKQSDILYSIYSRQKIYVSYCIIITIIVLIFAVIGIYNNISENNRSRKQEFTYYNIFGMTKEDVKKLRRYENSYSFIFTIIYTIIASIFLIVVCGEGMTAFGGSIIDPIISYLKVI